MIALPTHLAVVQAEVEEPDLVDALPW